MSNVLTRLFFDGISQVALTTAISTFAFSHVLGKWSMANTDLVPQVGLGPTKNP